MFLGNFDRIIDEKKRIAIPPQFLREFSGIDIQVIIAQSPEKCLYFFPSYELEKIIEKFKKISPLEIIQIKSRGRISISRGLKKYAGLEREVVLVGCFNYIEIWNKREWNEEKNREIKIE